MKYPRPLKNKILQSLKVSPVTLLVGPRQSGKTTLIKEIAQEVGMDYITFDTLKQLSAAQEDPEGFVRALKKPVVLDEIQRALEITLPIKQLIDEKRIPGFFGLTGSANPLTSPALNDSLAGRMFILNMWPLSRGEILQKPSNFLELAFDPHVEFSPAPRWEKEEIVDVLSMGGYPDAILLEASLRDLWFDNLLTTIIERDVKDIGDIARPRDLVKLLNILAARPSNLLNLSELSRVASIPYSTLNHYMALLEALFLIVRLPAWHVHRTKRLIKMPKLHFCDTGLLINQLRIAKEMILTNGRLLGYLLENFVFLELKKLASWSLLPIDLYHFRTQTGDEVDLVLKNRAGQIVGVEIKASETISPEDWKGIDILEKEVEDKMVRGIILYPGSEVVRFRHNRIALPLTTLWKD